MSSALSIQASIDHDGAGGCVVNDQNLAAHFAGDGRLAGTSNKLERRWGKSSTDGPATQCEDMTPSGVKERKGRVEKQGVNGII